MNQNNENFNITDAQIEKFFYTFKQEPLGHGGNSNVYLAQHKKSSVYFALKEPKQDQASQNSIINEIKIFIELWQKNNNQFPGCIPYVEKISETHKIVMEYLYNGSLLDILLTSGRFEEKVARTLAISIFNSIVQLHHFSVYHFDLKPDNIMFTANMILKICDFGYANNPIGYTQGYAAPEQIKGQIVSNEKCDVFAFGVILFILVMGFPPFQHYDDNWYKLIEQQKWEEFWEKILQNGKNNPSFQFKELIARTICANVYQRQTLQEIVQANWWNLEKVSDQQCNQELEKRINLRRMGYYKY